MPPSRYPWTCSMPTRARRVTVSSTAAGLDVAMEAVEDCCAGLAQRGQFLVASGIETWPDGTVTERYGWQHALHQEVVYARVPVGRRLRLHRRIGAREETGYGTPPSGMPPRRSSRSSPRAWNCSPRSLRPVS